MSARHVQLLDLLLEQGRMSVQRLGERSAHLYRLANPAKAAARDLGYLVDLGAISIDVASGGAGADRPSAERTFLDVNLKWPTEITETEFFRRARTLPKGKVHGFLSR